MKTIFRTLGMGAALAVAVGLAAVSGFAQDACSDTAAQDALQNKIRETYAKEKPTAIEAGKQLLEKYGTCPYSKDFVDWLKVQLPKWEDFLVKQKDLEVRKALFARFDGGIQNKNWDEVYAAGSEIVSKYPNDAGLINQLVPLGVIGLYQSHPSVKNYKFNDQSIRYADMAIAKLKAGDAGTKKDPKTNVPVYGIYDYTFTKEDALSELNYAKSYIAYWVKGDKKAALPLYYEVIQMPGIHKNDPYGYATIAGYYADEAGKLGTQYRDLVAQRKPDNTPEVAAELETKIKTTEGMLKGYLDRALDAYSRAYNFTKNDAANKQTRDGIRKTIEDLYKLRFQKPEGIDAYIASTVAKPMPNPTTEVTPVVEADTTTTTGGTGTGVGAANGTGVGGANGTGIGNTAASRTAAATAKPATTTAKPATATAKTVPTKPRK